MKKKSSSIYKLKVFFNVYCNDILIHDGAYVYVKGTFRSKRHVRRFLNSLYFRSAYAGEGIGIEVIKYMPNGVVNRSEY